jgi:hypothetical protein
MPVIALDDVLIAGPLLKELLFVENDEVQTVIEMIKCC